MKTCQHHHIGGSESPQMRAMNFIPLVYLLIGNSYDYSI